MGNLGARVRKLEKAAPRATPQPEPLGVGELAEGLAAWVEQNREQDTYQGRAAKSFAEALGELVGGDAWAA